MKKSTSSKKTDTAPPSANKARASKNPKAKPTGNEAAFKDKAAGRSANKSKAVADSAVEKKSSGKKTDRHSRSGKSDSDKKIRNAGWTADGETELENEIEGAEDAAEELIAENKPVKKSLADYLNERTVFAAPTRAARKVEALDDAAVVVKEQEDFIAATKTKNVKSKALKTKQTLDFEATFADETFTPSAPSSRGGRGSSRGGRGGNASRGRGAAKGAAPKGKKGPAGPAVNDVNFPSLA